MRIRGGGSLEFEAVALAAGKDTHNTTHTSNEAPHSHSLIHRPAALRRVAERACRACLALANVCGRCVDGPFVPPLLHCVDVDVAGPHDHRSFATCVCVCV